MMKIGLIAGSGKFPLVFAQEAQKTGAEIVALGIKGVTDSGLDRIAPVEYFKLGQIEKPLQFLKKAGVTQAVMAGKVQHHSLFGGILPDLRALKLLAKLKDRRTDTILEAVASEFAKEGITLLPSSTYLSHLLAPAGILTRRRPTPAESADIDLGWRAAKALAGFDIGQTVVVKEGAVIAVEAMEGTDATIERAAALAASHGFHPPLVVIKVAKPKQDLRFDLPVLGLDSLEIFERCKVQALSIEAGKTLLFDKDKFIAGADRLKMTVVAVEKA